MFRIIVLSYTTFKEGVRDRILVVIGIFSVFFFLSTSLFSSFSLRQATAVAIDYNLSIIFLLGLLLVLFIGTRIIAGDIDKRSIYTVISLPLSRGQYILGKFLGFSLLILVVILILTLFSIPAILITQYIYPQGIVIHWSKIFMAIGFIYLKLTIIGAVIFLFSSVGTSTIFPLLMGISFYFAGESIEEVLIYVNNTGPEHLSPVIKYIVLAADLFFPNLSALDLKATAIYGLSIDSGSLALVALYAVSYIGIVLILTILCFQKREFL